MAWAWLGTFLPCNINFLRELLTQRWNLGRVMYKRDWRGHQFHARLECSRSWVTPSVHLKISSHQHDQGARASHVKHCYFIRITHDFVSSVVDQGYKWTTMDRWTLIDMNRHCFGINRPWSYQMTFWCVNKLKIMIKKKLDARKINEEEESHALRRLD